MKIQPSIYRSVEEVLSKYPLSWQRNYYQNKKNLIVKKRQEIKPVKAFYNQGKNQITIHPSHEENIPHALFHMAFRDKDKVGKELTKGCGIIYQSGVSFFKEGKEIQLISVTEGFSEYLSRFCSPYKEHSIEYFFIDLLLSIYGEEILQYPLLNDPVGFLFDERFYNIFLFSKKLDLYYRNHFAIQMILHFKEELDKKTEENVDLKREIVNAMEQTMEQFNKSIMDVFNSIIMEYMFCKCPKVEKELFIKKLSSFLTNPDYAIAFAFEEQKFSLRDSIQNGINFVKKNKK